MNKKVMHTIEQISILHLFLKGNWWIKEAQKIEQTSGKTLHTSQKKDHSGFTKANPYFCPAIVNSVSHYMGIIPLRRSMLLGN